MRGDVPSKKKVPFPINQPLSNYLTNYSRNVKLPLQYEDLLRISTSLPLIDMNGEDTLWETVFYEDNDVQEINKALTLIYALLMSCFPIKTEYH